MRVVVRGVSRAIAGLVGVAFVSVAPVCGAQATGGAAAVAASAAAADSIPVSLTLDDAIALALRNNPGYLQTAASRRTAAAAVRSARGGLLPQLNASLTGSYQQGGQQPFNGTTLGASSDVLQSTYDIGLTYSLNRATLLAPRQARANAEAVDADVTGARETLRASVRQQYLTVLESDAKAILQDTLVANARLQLELARARAAVGSGTILDVRRAEVALGQQQSQQLQARNQAAVDRLRLFQQLGVPAPERVTLAAPTLIDTTVPPLATLLAMAQRQNPGVNALRARERAADVGVAVARSAYTPTLALSTGKSGYTSQYRDPNFLVLQERAQLDAQRESCVGQQEVRAALGLPNTLAECTALTLTDAQAAAVRAQNDQFPWHFTNSPRNVTLSLSLPLFDGFAREQRVQEATVQHDDARYARRERELALTADVTAAYLTLQTAHQTVLLQEQNAAKAKTELTLVQDQYTVGLATFVDLTTSRATYAQAESDRITALYDYHKAFAALESAVGRPLQ